MNNKKYIYLSADKVVNIKQGYYDEILNIKNLINDSERQSSILRSSLIDIDEELKYIKIAIKNTIFLIKKLDNSIDLEEDAANSLEKRFNSNSHTSNNDISALRHKITELEKMKNNLIMLEARFKALINRKKELLSNKRNAKKNIKTIDKNLKVYKRNMASLHFSLIMIDDASINSNGYVKEKSIKPKLKQIKKIK